MNFQKKIFLSIFIVSAFCSFVGLSLSYYFFDLLARKEFEEVHSNIALSIASAIQGHEKLTDQILVNAVNVLKEVSKNNIITENELEELRVKLGVSNLYIINGSNGNFELSTSGVLKGPKKPKSLFEYNPEYKKLSTGELNLIKTPLLSLGSGGAPSKFAMLSSDDNSKIFEAGINVNFISENFKSTFNSYNSIKSIELLSPNGSDLGSLYRVGKKSEISTKLMSAPEIYEADTVLRENNEIIFIKRIEPTINICVECMRKGLSSGESFYYKLILRISLDRVNEVHRKNFKYYLIAMLILAIVSFIFSKHLSISICRNLLMFADRVENYENGIQREITINSNDEIGILVKAFNKMILRIEKSKENIIEIEKAKSSRKIASQVAHDIRSPLTALEMAAANIDFLDEDTRIMIRGGVARIRDIANNLLETRKDLNNGSLKSGKSEISLLSSLIEPIISEKRTQNRDKIGLDISFRMNASTYGIFSDVDQVEFKRLLSNLINNATEALPNGKGKVEVELDGSRNEATIRIVDNGIGMPESILKQLGQEGKTFGKDNGNGLGVFHAKITVEGWGGRFHINSQEGNGTEVVINLKKTEAPKWFVEKIKINADVVILDDDESIHSVWDNRFKVSGLDDSTIHHFSSSDEAKNWFETNKRKKFVFLCDFELIGQNTNGINFIESLGISDHSILVTSRYDEKRIREKCKKLGIKLIPKPLASCVPIEISYEEEKITNNPLSNENGVSPIDEMRNPSAWGTKITEAIYIDDDKYLRMGWNNGAKKKGIKLHLFESPEDFKEKKQIFDSNIHFFIDSTYGEGQMRGEDFARELHNLGYKNLYLATGYDAEKFQLYSFLKGVIGKDPPWEDSSDL